MQQGEEQVEFGYWQCDKDDEDEGMSDAGTFSCCKPITFF